MKPRELIEVWVNLLNAGAFEKNADLFPKNAINYLVANDSINAKENILSLFKNKFAAKLNYPL